jgi:hypothetical protein
VIRTLNPQLHPGDSTPVPPHGDRLSQKSGHINGHKVKPKVISPNPRKVEKVGDKPIQPLGLPLNCPPNLNDLVPGDDPIGQRLSKPPH